MTLPKNSRKFSLVVSIPPGGRSTKFEKVNWPRVEVGCIRIKFTVRAEGFCKGAGRISFWRLALTLPVEVAISTFKLSPAGELFLTDSL